MIKRKRMLSDLYEYFKISTVVNNEHDNAHFDVDVVEDITSNQDLNQRVSIIFVKLKKRLLPKLCIF